PSSPSLRIPPSSFSWPLPRPTLSAAANGGGVLREASEVLVPRDAPACRPPRRAVLPREGGRVADTTRAAGGNYPGALGYRHGRAVQAGHWEHLARHGGEAPARQRVRQGRIAAQVRREPLTELVLEREPLHGLDAPAPAGEGQPPPASGHGCRGAQLLWGAGT